MQSVRADRIGASDLDGAGRAMGEGRVPAWLSHVLTDSLWVGGATWGAGLITIVGLALTYWQAGNARQAAEAARQAATRTVRRLSQSDHLVDLGEASQLTLRIKEHAAAGHPEAVRMGLEMLRAKIDSLEATGDGGGTSSREHRSLDHSVSILERHIDEAAISPAVDLDPGIVSSHLNDVRRVLSRRVERVKRFLPEEADG